MAATHYLDPTAQGRTPPGRRALSFGLALAIELLLLLAFFTINFRDRKRPEFEGGRLTTFDISPDSQADRSKPVQKEREVTPERPRLAPPMPRPEIKLPERPLQMIEMTPEDFRATDIARLGSNAPDSGARMAEAGGAGAPGDSARVGTAPNGEPLYAAEWYREPTHAELNAYLPRTMPERGGWGMVACRTAPRFRVEDCVELGNSPPGSHLAGAVRQAAWQFKVRPPRIGGKPMIGEWVRIRIDYQVN